MEVEVAGSGGMLGQMTELIAYDTIRQASSLSVRTSAEYLTEVSSAVLSIVLCFVFRTFLDLAMRRGKVR